MAFRGDDEPEYIDDDEYFDPDDLGGSGRHGQSGAKGRGRSNVLGASGSRNASASGNSAAGPTSTSGRTSPDRDAVKKDDYGRELVDRPSGQARRTKKSKPGYVPPRDSRPKNSAKRERNSGSARDESRNTPRGREIDETEDGNRSFSLLGRFRRGESAPGAKADSSAKSDNAKPKLFAAIGVGVGKIRKRFSAGQAAADNQAPWSAGNSQKPAVDDKRDRSIRAAFGASRGETREGRRKAPTEATSSARFDRKPTKAPPENAAKRPRPSKAPIFEKNDWLDLDRKLDLIGVGLVFGAIVLFFSALSSEQAAISAVNTLIGQLLGWGALAVPLTMFAIGMWLIIRHFGDQAPTVDPIRLAGVIIAFSGALVLFQFLESFSYAGFIAAVGHCAEECMGLLAQASYQGGRGGGIVGAWSYLMLVNNLTEVGGFIVVLMVLTFSAMMITRMTMAEIAVVAIGFARGLRGKMAEQAAKQRARRLQAQQQMAFAQQDTTLHVSKPAARELPGAVQGIHALPEPTSATMPIPNRLRDLLTRRVAQPVELDSKRAESAGQAIDPAANQGVGVLARLFSWGGKTEPEPLESGPAPPSAVTPTQNRKATLKPQSVPAKGSVQLGRQLWKTIPKPDLHHRPASDIMPQKPPSGPQFSKPAPALLHNRQDIAPAAPPPFPPPKDEPADEVDADLGIPSFASPAADEPTEKSTLEPTHQVTSLVVDEEPVEQIVEESQSSEDLPDQVLIAEAKRVSEETEEYDPAPEPQMESVPTRVPQEVVKPVSSGPINQSRPRVDWHLPDFRALLTGGSSGEMDQEVLLNHAQVIEETLASFGAPGRVVELNSGPVITQFGVEPDYLTSRTGKRSRVKVSAIAQLDKDLQLALGAKSIRVEAPVPGKGYVGIEVPNPNSAMVSLRDVMVSDNFQKIDSPLAIALGMSVDGSPVSADLTQMPHLLIAGTTGSGKSKCINAIIVSILANCSPDDVKFIMVDPKRVELTGYNGLPHLVAPVVVELERIVGVLRWVTREMDDRYKKFSNAGARNIIDYNNILESHETSMPYIVVIIDELADLMMMAPDETERSISRIAALARATGIHLVIATQRPSVDVVTGLIKANFPARIAFAVAGSVDSRVILDQPGAERLLGKGDMLYLSGDAPAPLRMQGVFVSDEEINTMSRFWKMQGHGVDPVEPINMPSVPQRNSGASSAESKPGDSAAAAPEQSAFWEMSAQRDLSGMAVDGKTGNPDPQEDELYETAVEMVRRLEKASISLLQRRLRIGYTRAARIVDIMEERGVVGPPKEGSSKPRDVLPMKK